MPPNILLVCRQWYSEARSMPFMLNDFHFPTSGMISGLQQHYSLLGGMRSWQFYCLQNIQLDIITDELLDQRRHYFRWQGICGAIRGLNYLRLSSFAFYSAQIYHYSKELDAMVANGLLSLRRRKMMMMKTSSG
jgi:hypothetical protein